MLNRPPFSAVETEVKNEIFKKLKKKTHTYFHYQNSAGSYWCSLHQHSAISEGLQFHSRI
jgi:hypothetical protein